MKQPVWLVAFACKARGFCPSGMGRRMCDGAALLVDELSAVVSHVGRGWVGFRAG
jgi:hypothetical protein